MVTTSKWGGAAFWGALTYLGLGLSALTWMPIFSGVGIDIELSNLVQLIFILLLPILLVFSRPALAIHVLFALMLAWSLILLLAMSLHGTDEGTGIVRQQLAQALFGWSLALCIANSTVSVSRTALVGLLIVLGALEFSAIAAGRSLTAGAVEFVQVLNRDQFIYGVIRPALNVFTNQEDLVFLASEINNVANSIVLLACLIFFREPGEQGWLEVAVGSIIAGLGLLLAFVIFSTSAAVVIAVFAAASFLRSTRRQAAPVRILAILSAVGLLVVLYQPMSRFLALNIVEDEASRGARVEQFEYAVGAINSGLLGGVGYSDAGGHVIHNWALFSWATAGIVAFFLVVAVYLTITILAYRLVREVPRAIPVVLALLVLFLIRTSVGGAGGIPSGPSVVAAALLAGLLVRPGRSAERRPISPSALRGMTRRRSVGGVAP